jgi:hypothetical protein
MTTAAGQLRALAGGVGEAVGATDFARDQYAKAAQAEQLAATQAPEVSDWRQVTDAPDLSTGLRRAGQYVAGLAGQSAPLVGLGLGAGALTALTGGGALPALAAGTAAVAPFETGGALQRQQHDPAALANNSAGARLGTAALEGTGRALAMNAVPQLMGGKLLGKAVGAETVPGILAEGVGGNALAGAAAEKISTTAEGSLNPNRDTSGDNTRMLDAAVAGGALGLPFAGAGIAGHALRGKAGTPAGEILPGAAPGAVPDAAPKLVDRIKNVFAKGDDSAEKIAAGRDVIDVEALKNAPPEQQVAMVHAADAARVETTKGWFDELMQDGTLSEENKQALAQAAGDFTDRANQAVVAGVKLAQDAGGKAMNMATEFYNAVTKKDGEQAEGKPAEPMPLKSAVGAGADQAIAETVAPRLAEKYPQLVANETAMKSVTAGLRRVMAQMQDSGKVDRDVAEHLQNWFGDDTPTVLAELHDRVLGDDPQASEKYFTALNNLGAELREHGALVDKVKRALPKELQDSATPEQLRQMVQHLQEYVSGALMADKPDARRVFESRQIEDGLRAHFGDKTDGLLKAVKQDFEAKRDAADMRLEDDRAAGKLGEDHIDYAPNDESGLAAHEDAGVTTERDTHKQYFGGGRDKANPTFVLSEQAHRAQYGNEDSQAARVLRDVAAKHPDMNVSTVSAREYAREHGIPEEQLKRLTNNDPDNHVLVKAEGIKREGLTWQDVDKVKLNTHDYPDSKSRIDTEAGTTLDAYKVMNMYAQEHTLPRTEQDAANPMYRLRRQFAEAIGALSDHLGENIEVDKSTVVARRAGRDITWGELQKAGSVKDKGMTDALYTAREAAVKAEDKVALKDIDAQLDARILRENDPADVLPDGGKKAVAVNNERGDMKLRTDLAGLAKALGGAREAAEREISRNGPLRDGEGKLRSLSMAERSLIRDHDKLVNKYNRVAERLGEKRFEEGALEHVLAKEGNKSARLTKEDNGPAEADPFGNVHAAAREHGDRLGGVFAGARNMEAGPEGNLLHASNFAPDTHFDGRLSQDIVSAVAGRVQQFELGRSAAARAIGTKGRHLLDVLDQMKKLDQAELASIVKEKSGNERAATINALYAKYQALEPAAKKPSAFVDRVVGKGDVTEVVKTIKTATNPKDIQRAVDALLPHQHDASAREVLEAANARIARLIEKDPGVAYSMQQVNPGNSTTSNVRANVRAHIEQVLGKTVDVEFAKLLHAGEFVTDKARVPQGLNADVIRISTHILDPMSVGYHESLHAFFAKLHDSRLMDAVHPLMKAASGEHVLQQLRTLLAHEPDALKQLTDPHERAAYMYQFWAAGKLQLKGKPAGILGHIAAFFRKTLGLWANDARAEHIMEYFHSGEYAKNMGDRSAVGRVLSQGTNAHVDKFKTMIAPLGQLANAVAATGDARLRGTAIPALVKLADAVYAPLHGEHGADPGYMPAARAKRGEFMNRLAESLAGHEPVTITDAMEAMQRGEKGATPKERQVVATIRKTLDDTFDYMKDAGVRIKDLGYGRDYFPRVWDPQTILAHEPEFRAMLEKYRARGEFGGSTDQVIATLTRTDGADLQTETVKPGMQNSKKRVLDFITGQDAAPFVQKDLYFTLNSYITQATRRAEWARRFKDDGSALHDLLHEAQQQGATKEDLQLASDYLQGVDGTLGDHIDPKLRRAFGNMIVYQNVRLLPLAIFSSLIDPMGILVRGGTVGDAFSAMKRGFAEIPKGFKKDAQHDSWTQLAAQLGVIDNAVLMHSLGSSYSQGMTSNFGRKLNDTFFKYNLMEQFNSSMRVAATQAAVGFLGRHADGTASQHSARWLAELGFKPGEVIIKNGEPLITRAQFESHGLKPADAQVAADKMTLAVNKWVDGAILRPNAAHKPVWMNDPHFALVAHLKQFVYSFQETILKRVANEVSFGNVGPAYALASYVPFMLAADTMKGLILGGGEQPDWKQGWDAGDYLFYEVQRAGLFGVGQFGVDAAKDLHRGGMGIGALAGPTIEQLGEAAKTVAGPEQFKTFALNALPANALFDAAGNATASTNAID